MSLFRAKLEVGETPHEIAADWALRAEAGRLSPAELACLEDWLAADPSHRKAWEDTRLALDTISKNAADPELMSMRSAALAARGEQRWNLHGLAAAAAVVVLGFGGFLLWRAGPPLGPSPPSSARHGIVAEPTQGFDPNLATYRTAVGERSAISLPDGSIAKLDTDSELKVAYTAAERGIQLLRGQAMFEVAKHKPTLFQVYAGDRRITAVGTRFDVRIDRAGGQTKVTVSLLEGVVKVTPTYAITDAPAQVIIMSAGEQLRAAPARPATIVQIDTDRVASWWAGELTFNDAPLSQAVAEMNRYTTRPIELADPSLAGLRVSGVFKTGDPEHFATTMAEAFPIRVDHDASGAPILKPRS